jgi:hypothetical protein
VRQTCRVISIECAIGAIEDAPVLEPAFEIVAPAKNSGPSSVFDDSSELIGWPNTIDADA